MYKRQRLRRLPRSSRPRLPRLRLRDVYKRQVFSFTNNALIQAFGGTSVLIMVGVVMDTIDKVESQLKMYDYDGFFK